VTLITVALYLYLVQNFLRQVEILSIESPQLALEKLRLLRSCEVAALAILTALFSGLFFTWAARVYRTGQYPPPGAHVAVGTRTRTGRDARVMVALFIVVVLAIAICGSAMVRVMWSAQDLRLAPPLKLL
jgi:hypothetical protein